MKYAVAIVITMAGLNAFIMWCMCAAAGKEDWQMEEMMRRRRNEKDESGTSDNN